MVDLLSKDGCKFRNRVGLISVKFPYERTFLSVPSI